MNNNLIFGTWELDGNHKSFTNTQIKQLLMYAKKCGIYMFDTALVYGDGNVEKLLGEVIGEDDYIITKVPAITKPALEEKEYKDFYSFDHIANCINKSLKNLKRQRIECVLLHNWSSKWNEQPLTWLLDHKQKGVVKEIGISLPNNFKNRLSDEILNLIDVVELPYNSTNTWSANDISYYKSKGNKVYIRSIFNKGKDVKQKNDFFNTIKNAKEFNCPLIIGMTTHKQIHNNYLWTLSNSELKSILDDTIFNN